MMQLYVAPGRALITTPVYDTYWRFAAERQALFMRRVRGESPPWTLDPILAAHRFTNVYRASDRVSQYLIRRVIYEGSQAPEEVFFRTILFKIFNRVETWEAIVAAVGWPSWKTFGYERYAGALDELMLKRITVYSAAYIMPNPPFGEAFKHRNHLRLLERMMREGVPNRIARAKSLRDVFEIFRGYPSVGDFLAFQFAIDLNYSEVIDFSEMSCVVAGPGARDGIRKCFSDIAGYSDEDVIRIVTERADAEIIRLGLHFENLWGRPLQLIDCQNIFCEVGKYARVVHPEFSGVSGRTRIKQKFVPRSVRLSQWYPSKWGVSVPDGLVAADPVPDDVLDATWSASAVFS